VLDGDPRLVIVAVRDPRLELDLRERSLVHAHVERVVVVVAARALAAEPVDELLARERPFHSSSSMPSVAISQPTVRTVAASGESSRRRGFVLFTWMNTRCLAGRPASAARLPVAPPTG